MCVAAIDDDVARVEPLRQHVDVFFRRSAGRYHHPDDARAFECRHHVFEAVRDFDILLGCQTPRARLHHG